MKNLASWRAVTAALFLSAVSRTVHTQLVGAGLYLDGGQWVPATIENDLCVPCHPFIVTSLLPKLTCNAACTLPQCKDMRCDRLNLF